MWRQQLTREHALFGCLLVLVGYVLWGPPHQAARFTDPARYAVHSQVAATQDGVPFVELEWRPERLQPDGTMRCGMCYRFELLEGPVIRDMDFILIDGKVIARQTPQDALAGY